MADVEKLLMRVSPGELDSLLDQARAERWSQFTALARLKEKPHQTRLYFSCISSFLRSNRDVVDALEKLLSDDMVSDYQRMFLLAALLRARGVERSTVNTALQWLRNPRGNLSHGSDIRGQARRSTAEADCPNDLCG
jgi:hypothetical protein